MLSGRKKTKNMQSNLQVLPNIIAAIIGIDLYNMP